jgi:hypothetical protein
VKSVERLVTVGRGQDTAKVRRQAGVEAKPLNRIAAIGAVQYNPVDNASYLRGLYAARFQ